jgi:glucose/arabinose dehydrogenase
MSGLLLALLITTSTFATEWVKKLSLPKGFKVEKIIEAKDARQMTRSPDGTLYVGTMQTGVVYQISPEGKVSTLFSGLNLPQGVLWHQDTLYVAEVHRISKVANLKTKPTLVVVKEFPNKQWHGWKTIHTGPDGKLYVPIGAPCNVCEEKLPFGAIHRMDFDGKNLETVATGLRNTVGYTWHPVTKELYFNEMGRDLMGEDIPPDEINVVSGKTPHFGFPYIHGHNNKDPKFYSKKPKDLQMTPPLWEIPAHSAPIGIAFFPADKYPKEFHNCFLVAEHGSWNRTKKSGYKVAKGCVKDGKISSYEPFITGFKEGEKAFGRPVHFLFLDDGSFYLSEDEPGTILLIRYTN